MAVAMSGTSTENIPSPRWLTRFVAFLFGRRVTFDLRMDLVDDLHGERVFVGFRDVRFFIARVMLND